VNYTIHELLGHRDVTTTTIYTHVLNHGGLGVKGPLFAPRARRGSRCDRPDVYRHGAGAFPMARGRGRDLLEI
jgi:hypothetical protein